MKLNEITNTNHSFITDKHEIEEILRNAGLSPENEDTDDGFIIHSDSSVSFSDDLRLTQNMFHNGKLLFKLHHVHNDLLISRDISRIESMEGFPEYVGRNLIVSNKELKTLEFVPRTVNYINIESNPITSLIGVADLFERVYSISLSWSNVTSGGLGVLLIPGLHTLYNGPGPGSARGSLAWIIINNYVGRPEDIFECQADLIIAGLEEYAQL